MTDEPMTPREKALFYATLKLWGAAGRILDWYRRGQVIAAPGYRPEILEMDMKELKDAHDAVPGAGSR